MPLTSVFPYGLDWELYKFPPSFEPRALPPPRQPTSIAYPFNIPSDLYAELLDVKYPVSIAVGYATIVTLLNQVNKSRGNKPWAISRSGIFTLFVLAHNIFLALYSGWTFIGMLRAMSAVFGGITKDFPPETYGAAPIVDVLCKMSGPRGLGNAASFDPFNSQWSVKNTAVRLLSAEPDFADVGRIWNEGLAFYGWIFYLSKFYEVLDTLIILAKGKRSSLLQTYHHAGAMMCMWAGIRFMSPPIWLFVQLNSGIHTLMYFYYTIAALGIKVPNSVKRSLTSLQIMQFIIGVNFAIAHLFVGYQIPVNTPYIFKQALSSAVSSVTSALPSAASAVASAGVGSWLKKGALRAAGFEGLAENLKDSSGQRFGLEALKAQIAEDSRAEIRYRMEYPVVHCIDTSGQAFAIWLNCLYLAPLTYLFGRFFYTSYIKRAAAATREKQAPQALTARMARSSSDAAKGVDREIRQAMGDAQGYNSPIDDEFAIDLQDDIDNAKLKIASGAQSVKKEIQSGASTIKKEVESTVSSITRKVQTTTTTSSNGYVTASTSETTIKNEDEQAKPIEEVSHTDEHTHQELSISNSEHDAHVKAGESYADAVKTEMHEGASEHTHEESHTETIEEAVGEAMESPQQALPEGTSAASMEVKEEKEEEDIASQAENGTTEEAQREASAEGSALFG